MKKFLTWVMFVVLILLFAGAIYWNQRGAIKTKKQPTPPSAGQGTVTLQKDLSDSRVLRAYNVAWNGKTYVLSQRCASGDVQQLTAGKRSDVQNAICVGTNRLILTDNNGQDNLLDETAAVNPSGAPALYGASVNAAGILSVDYAIDNCAMFGECAASSTPHTPILYDLATMKLIPS